MEWVWSEVHYGVQDGVCLKLGSVILAKIGRKKVFVNIY